MHIQKKVLLGAFIAAGIFLSGCMTFEVGSNASETQESYNNSEIVHGSIYGYRWREYHVQKCDDGPLARVEYNFNWIELLASSLSLGFYVPQTVEWWCDDSITVDDEDEPGLNPTDELRRQR